MTSLIRFAASVAAHLPTHAVLALGSVAALFVAVAPVKASQYVGTGAYTVEPGGWNVGDTNSTHMIYDTLLSSTPDVNVTNPAGLSVPSISVNPPGFISGSNNLYSFVGNFTAQSDVFNHSTVSDGGTHVIVQTTATVTTDTSLGGPASVFANSLEIVDHSGGSIAGGTNSEALVNAALVASGNVDSTFGEVELEIRLWEFFLPDYTGDFRVKWESIGHSSFDQIRVDSMIAPTAFSPTQFTTSAIGVPEPTAIVLAALCGLGVIASSRRSRRQQ